MTYKPLKIVAVIGLLAIAAGVVWLKVGRQNDGSRTRVDVPAVADTALLSRAGEASAPDVPSEAQSAQRKRGALPPGAGAIDDAISFEQFTKLGEKREQIRFDTLKAVALRYGEFIERQNLGKEKGDLLLELLVDQRMAGIEAALQTSDPALGFDREAIGDAHEKNRELIENLLGEEGLAALDRFDRESAARDSTRDAVQAMEGIAPLGADARAKLEQVLTSFDPSAGLGDMIVMSEPITPELRREFRNHGIETINDVVGQLGSSISPAQAAALREWAAKKVDESVDHAAFVINANNGGGPKPPAAPGNPGKSQ